MSCPELLNKNYFYALSLFSPIHFFNNQKFNEIQAKYVIIFVRSKSRFWSLFSQKQTVRNLKNRVKGTIVVRHVEDNIEEYVFVLNEKIIPTKKLMKI